MNKKQFKLEIKKTKEPNTFEAIITNDSLDRDKEVLIPEGMDYKDFMKNPVVFFNHDYTQPIGKVLKLHKYKNQWKATVKIAERPSDFEGAYFPEYVFSLIDQDIIKGVSIGFQIKEGGTRPPSKKDKKDYGKDVRNIITDFILMELSIAPLQSNQTALITSVNKGLVTREQVKMYFNIDLEEEKKEEVIEKKEMNLTLSVKKNKTLEERVKREITIQLKKHKGELYI